MKHIWRRAPLAAAALLVALVTLPALGLDNQDDTGNQDNADAQAPPPSAAKPCSDERYRHFDFWVGTWEVRAKGRPDGPHGKNIITNEHGDCVLRENYTFGRYNGSSFNYVDSQTGRWHQTWVDNQGYALRLEGGLDKKGRMVLESDPTQSPINRITWTPRKNGNVRQHWQVSKDGGATWTDAFDGTYVKVDG